MEAHAAAVKPALATVASPTAVVAEVAKAEAEAAKASGDSEKAARAEALEAAIVLMIVGEIVMALVRG